jgi:hypothetical protein
LPIVSPISKKNKRGAFVDFQDDHAAVVPRGCATEGVATQGFTAQDFTTEDILWALGIWSVILSLSPVIVFYMLMVA